jgi:hypothetical protein
MKKHLLYLSILLLSCSTTVWSAPNAVFSKITKSYVLHNDGSQEMRVVKEVTLNTFRAFRSMYGESFITYNPDYQKLVVNESYTRQKDGNVVKTPANAFVECLPSIAADAPAYNGLKEMVVVHTGLELGATIYLDYTITTKAGYYPELDVCEEIPELSPIKNYTLSISVPSGKPFHYTLVNGNEQPQAVTENGYQKVTWNLVNVPARPAENGLSIASGDIKAILANTYPSLSTALDNLQKQFSNGSEAEVKTLAESLTAGKTTDSEKLEAIRSYVNTLSYCRVPLALNGYRFRTASEVISTNYATLAEKVNLTAALMQCVSLPVQVKVSYPVKVSEEYLGLNAIDNIFIDNSTIADVSNFYPVYTLKGEKVAIQAHNNTVNETDTINVTAESGQAVNGNYRMVTLPNLRSIHDLYGAYAVNTTRSSNLLLPFTTDETDTYLINLPANATFCSPTKPYSISNAVGKMTVSYDTSDGHLIMKRALHIDKQLIKASEYPEFYKLMTEWKDAKYTSLFVKL